MKWHSKQTNKQNVGHYLAVHFAIGVASARNINNRKDQRTTQRTQLIITIGQHATVVRLQSQYLKATT